MDAQDSISNVASLLKHLRKTDIAKLSSAEDKQFRTSVTEQFKEATAGFHHALLGDAAELDRWIWTVEQADSYGGEWISTYRLRDTRAQEFAFDAPPLVQQAVAIFAPISLSIELMGKYHHQGDGLQVEPRLLIELRVGGDMEKALTEHVFKLAQDEFQKISLNATITMRLSESPIDEITNPANFQVAFGQLVSAAKEIAKNDPLRDEDLPESVIIEAWFDWSCPVETLEDGLFHLGLLFKSVAMSNE